MVSLMRVAAAASRANLNIVSGSVSHWSSGARQREGVDTRASNDGRDFTITESLLPPLMTFALMSQFHQEKALLGAFCVIVKYSRTFVKLIVDIVGTGCRGNHSWGTFKCQLQ